MRCSAAYMASVLPSGTRKSFSPIESSIGVRKRPAWVRGLCLAHTSGRSHGGPPIINSRW
jgi:hypothetical protein